MRHIVVHVLATTSTTAPSSRLPTALFYGLAVLELVVGIGLAELRRWKRGSYPWRLHSVIWGLFLVITGGFAILLEVVAWFTTRPRASDGTRTASPMAQAIAARLRGRRVPAPEPEPPAGVVPGTYGTSLPPHDSSLDATAGDKPAGWLPDPTGRHQHRYWNGRAWSRHVADAGRRSVDEM
jgi:hypothetical protein